MKRKKPSDELKRTLRKIQIHASHPESESRHRILSATETQAGLALTIEAREDQPRQAGKKRTGHRGPLRCAIEKICGQFGEPNFDSALSFLQDNEAIEKMYEEGDIDIHNVEAYEDKEVIEYTLRNGKVEMKSFKRIKNLISEYLRPQ